MERSDRNTPERMAAQIKVTNMRNFLLTATDNLSKLLADDASNPSLIDLYFRAIDQQLKPFLKAQRSVQRGKCLK